MKAYRASATKIVKAPPEVVYAILADYRSGHQKILPKPYFLFTSVEQGGTGAGTIIRFQMRVLGTIRSYRAVISEPQPGRQLDEIYLEPDGMVTRFLVQPDARNDSRVTIMTEGKTPRTGLIGSLERLITMVCLRHIFRKELSLLAAVAEESSDVYFRRER